MPNRLNSNPIVYIDDDEDDQYFVKAVLEDLVIANPLRLFKDGLQALDYIRTTDETPLMILCAVKMPVMDGLSLREQINTDEYLRQKSIPFLFLITTYIDEVVQRTYHSMVQGFFVKDPHYPTFRDDFSIMYRYWQRCLQPNRRL